MIHNSRNPYYRSPMGAVATHSRVHLAIDIEESDNINTKDIDCVKIHLWREAHGGSYEELKMSAWSKTHYIIDLEMPEDGCLVWYYFIVKLNDGKNIYFGNNDDKMGGLGKMSHNVPPSFQITVFKAGIKTPDWFKQSVMYQIFPDRFYRSGEFLPKKKYAVYHCNWNDPPMYYLDPDTRQVMAYDYYGGNIKGIKEKLSYLKDLGISVIYFNPIFKSRANHHYDTADYYKVDPMFGTNEEFKELCAKADKMGIKIILDGVFSHTGSDSIYFNKFGNFDSKGACQSKESPYYEWYDFKKYPDEYDCWWGFDNMPNVKETMPSYMDFMIRKDDSVIAHWMKTGISGWRLDVIDELPSRFSRCLYNKVKNIDKDAVIIGEVWEDASNKVSYNIAREYLCGYEMDSAMNYPLRKIMLDFLLENDTATATQIKIANQHENYPKENLYAMMNLLGSHDVERILTVLGEAPSNENVPAIKQAVFKLDEKHLKSGLARLKMAVCWQMTMPGVPSIYYGDEIGMQGYKDPHNRASYKWDCADEKLRAYFKKMIAFRNSKKVLQLGWYSPAFASEDIFSYFRTTKKGKDRFGNNLEDDAILVILNRSKDKTIPITIDTHGFLSGRLHEVNNLCNDIEIIDNKAQIKIEPLSAWVFEEIKPVQRHEKKAGVLLHPTCLPNKYGIGDLGKEAYDFIDWLESANQSVWQVLPLNPVGYGASPYQSPSVFAGNTLLISPEKLVEAKLLSKEDIALDYIDDETTVDFVKVQAYKEKLLRTAFANFTADKDYEAFCQEHIYWLEDYAMFVALKHHYKNASWTKWDTPVRLRRPQALSACKTALKSEIDFVKFTQYIFFKQWQALHDYANAKNIKIVGDMPIFPSHDSVDVWVNQEQFNLNPDGTLKTAAGVPPDYFSADGQLWGNPHYLWDLMEKDDYSWWRQRFATLLKLVDIVRVDHFRGFESYWAVAGDAKTARVGEWIKGPGKNLFEVIKKYLGDIPIIAEDLGIITPQVEKLKNDCNFPGMKVLQFELYTNVNNQINFTCPENSIVYTGTHDNNTTLGWLKNDVSPTEKAVIADFLEVPAQEDIALLEKLMELSYTSSAKLAILPMQDILHLDQTCRMNLPGTVGTNWGWRMKKASLTKEKATWLKDLTKKYHRF